MRINRFLAQSGIASRRKTEELIKQGKVKVNGKVITNLATQIDSDKDEVTIDGKRIELPEEKVYLILNKPKGYVTTAKDTHGRPTVFDLLSRFRAKARKEGKESRLFAVGRLDMNSRGLLFLTNDGDWAYQLTHPKHKVPKTYEVMLDGDPDHDEIERLRKGVVLEEGETAPAKIKRLNGNKFEIIISQGWKRQVRRMFKAIGYKVIDLKRTKIGKYELGGLKERQYKKVNS